MSFFSKLFGNDEPIELAQTYRSTKHGVGFDYPAGWSVVAEDQLEGINTYVVRVGMQQPGEPSFGLTVIVMGPTQKDDDIEGYLSGSKAQFADAFPGFSAHKYKRIRFREHSAAWMEHSYDGSNGRVREASMTAFFDNDYVSIPLQLVFEAPSGGFGRSVATFQAILDSLKVDADGPKGNVDIRYV